MKFPKLKGKAVLSPMSGVTDVAFRVLCKKYGAALTYTEFVSSAAIVRDNKKSKILLETDKTEKPVAVQLFGNNVEEVVNAAKILQDKFDIIDVNCGCPAWKVIRTGAGSELLKNPKQIELFVRKLVNSVNVPVTIKVRTGINAKNINVLEVAKLIEDAGAAAIAIHGRTQEQGYSGIADWDIISKVKQELKIPVIGNGDVFTPEKFKECLDKSKVDAIMIARGAIGNPFIFKQIDDYLKKWSYEKENNLKLFFEYLELAQKHNINLNLIRNHAVSFTKGMENCTLIRTKLSKSKTIEEIKEIWTSLE